MQISKEMFKPKELRKKDLLQAKAGRDKEFENTLKVLRGKNVDISSEAANIIVNFQGCVFNFSTRIKMF